MPDFESEPLFPFQEEDPASFQDENCSLFHGEDIEVDEENTANTNVDDVENGDKEADQSEDAPEDTPEVPRRRLIIHGPRHPTLVDGSINSNNILCYHH
jgi:hypothetical protein